MKISSVTLDFWIDRGAAVVFLRQAAYQNFGKTAHQAPMSDMIQEALIKCIPPASETV